MSVRGMREESWPVEWGGGLAMGPLSTDLYRDPGQCVLELVRNGMVACMRDEDEWDPSRVRVEVEVVARHPLTGSDALVVMDAGSGFTPGDRKRFCIVGTMVDEVNTTRHGGAAQKRIGRLSCFALMRELVPDSTFFLCTRTSQDGPLTLVEISPRLLERRSFPAREIPSDATELGRYRNYRGRLSIFIVPNPKIRTNDELREEIATFLPRKRDLCGDIRIGGKPFDPPPLASGIVIVPSGADVEAYLERVEHGMRGGISLVDLATGFRVGFCPGLTAYLPYPLGRTDLGGDLFLAGLLAQQDTSRGGLRGPFLGKSERPSKAWQKIIDLLVAHVVEPARGLLDDSDVVGRSVIGQLIANDIADLCRRTWGPPDKVPTVANGLRPGGGGGGGHGGGGGGGPRKPRSVKLNIGGETWTVNVSRDDRNLLAVADADAKTVTVNDAYDIIPSSRSARMEHALLGLFGAIGRAKHPLDAVAATAVVSELRRDALAKEQRSRA